MEDLYSIYVHHLKISEEVFWNQPLSSVILIARNNIAMDNWKHSEQEKESKKKGGKR